MEHITRTEPTSRISARTSTILILLVIAIIVGPWLFMYLSDRPPAHEPFISTHQRNADIVTQVHSLCLDRDRTVKQALEQHGPNITADTSAGQMKNVIDTISVQTNGYRIYFGTPLKLDNEPEFINVGMAKVGAPSNESINVSVYAHKTEINQGSKPYLQKSLGLTEQQAEDIATQGVRLVLDTAGKNWPK